MCHNGLVKKALAAGFLLVSFPLLTSAATLVELQQQLQNLLSQVSALQSVHGAVLGTTISCPNFYRNLLPGMRGNDVRELQQFLIAQGLLAAGNDTGYYRPNGVTQAAVQAFQRQQAIVTSGTPYTTGYGAVGPVTRAAIALRSLQCLF